MIQSCLFLPISFFCFSLLDPCKKLKDLAPHKVHHGAVHMPNLLLIFTLLLFFSNGSVTYYQMLDVIIKSFSLDSESPNIICILLIQMNL